MLVLEITSQGTWKQIQKPSSRVPKAQHKDRKQMRSGNWLHRTEQRPKRAPAEAAGRRIPGKEGSGTRLRVLGGVRVGLGERVIMRAWVKSQSQSRLARHPHSQRMLPPSEPFQKHPGNSSLRSVRHRRLLLLAKWPTETTHAQRWQAALQYATFEHHHKISEYLGKRADTRISTF